MTRGWRPIVLRAPSIGWPDGGLADSWGSGVVDGWGEIKKKPKASYLEGEGVESAQSCLLQCPASPFFSLSLGERGVGHHVGVNSQQCHQFRALYNGSVTSSS
ncbi:hypothetical protein TIFTF001_018080 [Ficus carica]|uniref:Uncharacterized protein n=1 Tax=Ficus carica TaxID=3494 RepID=A0AA88A932_FICCA|nr:hypothetical protein TIFTF001_018080 [Ficus carica]